MRKSPTFNKPRICARCSFPFTPTGTSQKYCDDCKPIVIKETKERWYTRNNSNAYKPKKINYCVACGEKAASSFNDTWYCNKHWLRMYNNGTLEPQRKSRNKFIEHDSFVEVITTKGEVIIISKSDLHVVSKYTWCLSKTGYPVANINNKVIKLHRYILSPSENQIVDHINGNTLDNRRENLRFCTSSQNAKNCKLSKNSSLPYPGIKITADGKFKARITVNRKEIHLGHFSTLDEAIQARKSAELKYYGEFAPSLGSLKNLE